MDEQLTCGQGVAENAQLPAKLAELIGALAENLERHMNTLDVSDAAARRELQAYQQLAREHREISHALAQVAKHMTSYRDLPMGRHDEAALADARLLHAFELFVTSERELIALLSARVQKEQLMLAAARGAANGSSRS